MPNNKQIMMGELEEQWKKRTHGNVKQNGTGIQLYLQKIDFDDHVHIFLNNKRKRNIINDEVNDEVNECLMYNIKCNGNSGNDREEHIINTNQSIDDFITEILSNWITECRSHYEKYLLRQTVNLEKGGKRRTKSKGRSRKTKRRSNY